MQDGEHLTAVVQEIRLASAASAFVLWCCGGNQVVTWGDPDYDVDCAVPDLPWNVQQIQATSHAFAAILADGSVVAWGDRKDGGDCSVVQDQLRNVQQIQATDHAFAAILADGSVVAWGGRGFGGSTSAQKYAADSGCSIGICRDLGRWISGDLGRSTLWW